MVVIDATNLLLFLRPGTPASRDSAGRQIDRPKERIDYLIKTLDKAKTKLIIPTPALSEALVRAGVEASQQIIEQLQKFAVFQIEPFDMRAALEVATMTRNALAAGKKRGASTATWAKVKYDRQIVAIAKVNGATAIYSDDQDVASIGKMVNIDVVALAQLPLPPEKAQLDLALEPQDPVPATSTGKPTKDGQEG